MPTQFDNELLREGVIRYKAKEYESARRFLERALENSDDLETQSQANFYLSKLTDDPLKKRKLLENTLAVDMSHAGARRDLAILDGKLKPEEIVNPESMPAPSTGTQAVQADRFTCPKCGGRMVFAPDGVSLLCEFCQRSQVISSGKGGGDQDFFLAMANGSGFRKTVSMKSFQCRGCGAGFLLAPQEASATCAYCGSVHVIAQGEVRDLLEPDAIIPMAFDQEQANCRLIQWVEKNRLQPEGKVEPPKGMYTPVWSFDISGNIPWSGSVIKNKRTVPVSGEKPLNFLNVSVPASKSLAGLLAKNLDGQAPGGARSYDPSYLAGWPAEIYDLSMSDASLEARRLAVEKVRAFINGDMGWVIDLRYSASAITVDTYYLTLLPVWITRMTIKGQPGRVLINGVSGTVSSDHSVGGFSNWVSDLFGK